MRIQTFLAGLALCCLLNGCNKQDTGDQTAAMDAPDWLSEEEDSSSSASESQDLSGGDDRETRPRSPSQTQRDSRKVREPRGELKLSLQPGVQFPLKKNIRTTLVQTSSDGTEQRIQTDLGLLMAIQVEDVKEGRTLLRVRYNRVDFEQSMDGQKIVYHSQTPPAKIPLAAQAYHDMVNDGFAFWIGKDNQISETVDFHEFLQRCLVHVPADQQKQVLLGMEAGTDENGISDFVDNTIGLLPAGREVTPGQEWVRNRNIGRPVPMVVQNKYTLHELTNTEAVVRITGEIIPSQTINRIQQASDKSDANVTVLGGSTSGICTIFRDTGLPKDSYTERVVHMTVTMGDNLTFDQKKTVLTRVEAFPPVRLGDQPTE